MRTDEYARCDALDLAALIRDGGVTVAEVEIAVRDALADPARLERIAEAARTHALANLTPEAVAARVLAESLAG